ncbi:protein phosphatase regulator, partial [Coemansia guatemalensis]
MDDHNALVDVLLLPECNLYERYPELVQRVDYFLYDWCEEMLARTACLLRHQEQRMQKDMQQSGAEQQGTSNDETFSHKRSTNIVWRQWAVSRLQLPQYPPEHINWNKDADPAFLYGQVPALRLEVPWSARRVVDEQQQQQQPQLRLKSALKRTDLQTFLTSPTLSPASSPLHSPMYSPAVSIRENMSTSSFGSEDTLENDCELKPRLRFNDRVEQCMVVFDQEKECLPTDDEGDSAEEEGQPRVRHAFDAKRALTHKRRCSRTRRSLVIKLAPTHLKGDHRKLVAVTADAGSRYGYAAYCD